MICQIARIEWEQRLDHLHPPATMDKGKIPAALEGKLEKHE